MPERKNQQYQQVLHNKKSAELGIIVETPNISYPWFLTDRPFERKQKDYSKDKKGAVETLFNTWENAKYALGFQEKDLKEWKDKKYTVLEIGPGRGVSFAQLHERGIDIYALEPTLKFPKSDYLQEEQLFLKQHQAAGRIHTAN